MIAPHPLDIENFVNAVEDSDLDTLRALHQTYGDSILNARNEMGYTALTRAAGIADSPNALYQILEMGADLNATSKDGATALMFATVWSRQDRFFLLLKNGADPALCSNAGESVLHLASGMDDQRSLIALLNGEKKIDINLRDADLETPLMRAALNNRLSTAQILLDADANPLLANSAGLTPRDIALQGGRQALADLLKQAEDKWLKRLQDEFSLYHNGIALPVNSSTAPLKLRPPEPRRRAP